MGGRRHEAGDIGVIFPFEVKIIQNGIAQGFADAGFIAIDEDAFGLIDDEDVGVFIDDGIREFPFHRGPLFLEVGKLLIGNVNTNHIPLMENAIFGDPMAIGFDVFFAEGFIDKTKGCFGEIFPHEFFGPLALAGFGDEDLFHTGQV